MEILQLETVRLHVSICVVTIDIYVVTSRYDAMLVCSLRCMLVSRSQGDGGERGHCAESRRNIYGHCSDGMHFNDVFIKV